MPKKRKQMDTFADIAAKGIHFRDANLIEPQPPILEERYLQIEQSNKSVFQPMEKKSIPKRN